MIDSAPALILFLSLSLSLSEFLAVTSIPAQYYLGINDSPLLYVVISRLI